MRQIKTASYIFSLKLAKRFTGDNYHIHFDNPFFTIELLGELIEKGIDTCGTFRHNRMGALLAFKDIKQDTHTRCHPGAHI